LVDETPRTQRVTGRTPWDFAAEVLIEMLRAVGPVMIIVIGFLVFVYLGYQQINKARTQATKDLQASLDQAQNSLINNTKELGDMHGEIIQNITSMLELANKVDKNNIEQREKFAEEVKKEEEKLDKLRKEGENAAKSLERDIAKLEKEREELIEYLKEQKEKEIQNKLASDKKIEEQEEKHKQEQKELKMRELSLVKFLSPDQNYLPKKSDIAEKILKDFQSNPSGIGNSDKLSELIGLPVSDVQKLISEKDGLGYSAWFKETAKFISDEESNEQLGIYGNITGYTEHNNNGPEDTIVLDFSNEIVSSVKSVKGNIVVAMPMVENWYDRRYCVVSDEGESLNEACFDGNGGNEWLTWSQADLTAAQSFDGTDHNTEKIFGSLEDFKILSLDSLKTQSPEMYDRWRDEEDPPGSRGLLLDMIKRADKFDPAEVGGLQASSSLPKGLGAVIQGLFRAAVDNGLPDAERYLDLGVQEDLGRIAAMALRDGLQLSSIRDMETSVQATNESQEVIAEFTFDAADPDTPKRDGQLTFERLQGDEWRLTAFQASL